jgi:SpoU rRNA methylase family enzyme
MKKKTKNNAMNAIRQFCKMKEKNGTKLLNFREVNDAAVEMKNEYNHL